LRRVALPSGFLEKTYKQTPSCPKFLVLINWQIKATALQSYYTLGGVQSKAGVVSRPSDRQDASHLELKRWGVKGCSKRLFSPVIIIFLLKRGVVPIEL
jgi:hypothetical protein